MARASVVYDVCHNIAKLESHDVDGETRDVVVHRKGATRAFLRAWWRERRRPAPWQQEPKERFSASAHPTST